VLSLAIPWILLFLIVLSLVFLLFKKWKIGFVTIVLILILNYRFQSYPFTFGQDGEEIKKSIRVMTFNIDGASKSFKKRWRDIVNLIETNSPDLLFVAEYCEEDVKLQDSLLKKMLPYTTCDSTGSAHYFYSKFPLSPQKRLCDENNAELGIYTATLYLKSDSIILYGCHLASNNYTVNQQYISPDSINTFKKFLLYFKDIYMASEERSKEATVVKTNLERYGNKNYAILLGDLNDVGGSKTLDILKSTGLKDAWWEKGMGYGATIHHPLPYRIDHVMYTRGLSVREIKVIPSNELSDHDALLVEIGFRD
jgi:endonuclease/exonuclease/phosphatase (EEP) superfamily protein YafD